MNSRPSHDIVYFDGTCGLCHWFVKLLLKLDPKGERYRFAHGDPGASSVILVTASGQKLYKSDAVLHALIRSNRIWRAGHAIPRPLRDAIYDFVARNRRRMIKTCPLMPPEFRERFLTL